MNLNRYNGFLNIYKEPGWTSMDVCAKLRRVLGMKKIGHAGTLDPMAEGVLPVALGRATKDVERVGEGEKVYRAGLLLGVETDTEDITGTVLRSVVQTDGTNSIHTEKESADIQLQHMIPALEALPGVCWPTEEAVRAAILSFIGPYEQLTPMYSARKVAGKKLYQYARAGVEVERSRKCVEIYDIDIEEIRIPHVTFTVRCSRGTYIRTLCRDIGERLSCGACMESLVRLQVGAFAAEDALRISEVETLVQEGRLDAELRIMAPTALSLGKFDGTHMGHQALFKELKKCAEQGKLKTCVLILKVGSTGVLTDEERKRRLYDLGIDYVIELPFTEEMRSMSAEDFLEKILIGRYHMKAIVAGDDVSFGYAKRGNADFLREHAEAYGIEVRLIEKVRINLAAGIQNRRTDASGEDAQNPQDTPDRQGREHTLEDNGQEEQEISSTLLRRELQKGDMLHVTRLLGKPYAITGTVIHGRHLGTDRMHFPTMNIEVSGDLLLPPYGVYAVQARLADAHGLFAESPALRGIANLGLRPTVAETAEMDSQTGRPILETHLFGDVGDCYGRQLQVELDYYIRPEEKFENLEELKDHLREWDIPAAEAFFRNHRDRSGEQ